MAGPTPPDSDSLGLISFHVADAAGPGTQLWEPLLYGFLNPCGSYVAQGPLMSWLLGTFSADSWIE